MKQILIKKSCGFRIFIQCLFTLCLNKTLKQFLEVINSIKSIKMIANVQIGAENLNSLISKCRKHSKYGWSFEISLRKNIKTQPFYLANPASHLY